MLVALVRLITCSSELCVYWLTYAENWDTKLNLQRIIRAHKTEIM